MGNKGQGQVEVHPRVGREGPDLENKYRCNLSLRSALEGCGSLTPRPGRFISEKAQYPLYWSLGGSQGRFGQVWKFSLHTEFRSMDRSVRSLSG
jgi:hypothetical protein